MKIIAYTFDKIPYKKCCNFSQMINDHRSLSEKCFIKRSAVIIHNLSEYSPRTVYESVSFNDIPQDIISDILRGH